MKVVALDLETHYATDYSLSRMPTAAYIRDPRFEVIGLSYKVNDEPTQWVTGTKEEIRRALPEQTWWHDAVVVAHNSLFDSTILQHHFGARPKMLACTMSMAATLGMRNFAGSLALGKLADWFREHVDPTIPRKGDEVLKALGLRRADFTPEQMAAYGEYCKTDTEISYRLFKLMLPLLPAAEMRWHDVVLRMHTEPIFVLDEPLLLSDLLRVRARKIRLMGGLSQTLGCGVEKLQEYLGSNPKFAEVLGAMGVTPPRKISKTTNKETWAFAKTDTAMIELTEHPQPMVQAVVAARLGTKSTIEETRLEQFIDLSKIGSLALPYRISGAHTHRLSGCLVADTRVVVRTTEGVVLEKRIVDVQLSDLVWDGEAFVEHKGVVDRGVQPVVEWDGVEGTAEHPVYTNETGPRATRGLLEAMRRGETLVAARAPDDWEYHSGRLRASRKEHL